MAVNINQVLILLGEYVVKFHLSESRVESLQAELQEAKQIIEQQEIRLANAYDVMANIQEGQDHGERADIAAPR